MIHYVSQYDTLCRRIFCRVEIEATGCWGFRGALRAGYGRIQHRGRNLSVHRVVWELWHGPIAEGLQVHHACNNPACCNPGHLEAVTPRVHVVHRTPTHIAYKNARKTHCPRGHALTDDNLQPSFRANGIRKCWTCHREQSRNAMRRISAARRAGRV